MDKNAITNLINAAIEAGHDATLCDSDIIEHLIDCGLTEKDFIEYGFGDFVEDYFKEPDWDDEEYYPSSTNGDYSPSNPWDAPGMSIRDFIR